MTPEEQARFAQHALDVKAVEDRARRKNQLRQERELKHELDAEARGPIPTLTAVTADALHDYAFPLRRELLYRGETVVFREGHIGEIVGLRGLGKTWFMQTLALIISTGGEALGFRAPEARRVLYVDGEMASEDIRERFLGLSERTGLALTANLVIIGADWQPEYLPRLDTIEGQRALDPWVEDTDLVFLDNRSCLFDPEGEKDAAAWQPAGDWLFSLRKRSKGTMIAHHANRQGSARGHSKPEDPMDLLLVLARPEDYTPEQGARFTVTFEKTRGFFGVAAAPFTAALTPAGWRVEPPEKDDDNVTRKIREYLVNADAVGERPKTASAVIAGARVNRNDGFKAFAALQRDGQIRTHEAGGYVLKEEM